MHLDDAGPRSGRWCPRRRLELAYLVGRPHPDPDKPAGFTTGISFLLDGFRRAVALVDLRRSVDHVAFDIDLPSVVQAAQAALLVAPERKRRAPVRTMLIDHSEPAQAVPKRHQVLAQQAHPNGRAVGGCHFLGHARGNPVTPHQRAHRGAALDPAEQIVLFGAQHRCLRIVRIINFGVIPAHFGN